MACINGLAVVAETNAHVLILGSMPGELSLAKQQYYAHPRNAFWQIIATLFNVNLDNYNDKLNALRQHKLALWDVIHCCERQGSLDSKIHNASVVTNDFVEFFAQHSQIKHIFFNGSRAEQAYRKHVIPALPTRWQAVAYTRLPSTSPAMASLSFEQKLMQWQQILPFLD